jgi:hypothetical protein
MRQVTVIMYSSIDLMKLIDFPHKSALWLNLRFYFKFLFVFFGDSSRTTICAR